MQVLIRVCSNAGVWSQLGVQHDIHEMLCLCGEDILDKVLIVNDRVRGGTGLDKIQHRLMFVYLCLH